MERGEGERKGERGRVCVHYRRGIRVWESHRCMVFQEKERKREEKRRGGGEEVRFWMNRSFVRSLLEGDSSTRWMPV